MGDRDNRLTGYAAGIIAGISYGCNPLFAKPLLQAGVSVPTMLFFRYIIAMVFMGVLMLLKGEKFKVNGGQAAILAILGLMFSCSSIFLFYSYNYIPAGLATTLVFLYPVFTALIMVLFKEYPNWKVWLSIAGTLAGVVLMCIPSGGVRLNVTGMCLAVLSALSYAGYLITVNRSERAKAISPHTITFYALGVGVVMFGLLKIREGGNLLEGLDSAAIWGDLAGLGLVPTMVSLLAISVSTRSIGATRTSVLGVFEPLTAILIGVLVFDEAMTVGIACGAALCIAAVTFMVSTGRK